MLALPGLLGTRSRSRQVWTSSLAVLRQSEKPLGDQVPHDFAAATMDRYHEGLPEFPLEEPALEGHGAVGGEHPSGPSMSRAAVAELSDGDHLVISVLQHRAAANDLWRACQDLRSGRERGMPAGFDDPHGP